MDRRTFLSIVTFGLAAPRAPAPPPPAPPPPAPPRVPLAEPFVAGFRFHDGPETQAWLKPGTRLTLVRDPGNAHDSRAIRVLYGAFMLGFVPRDVNDAPARLLDHGRRVEATISHVDHLAPPWRRVRLRLELTS